MKKADASNRGAKKRVITIDGGSARGKDVKREKESVPPTPSPEVVELQQKLLIKERMYQRACRATREAELRAERAEALLDSQRDILVNNVIKVEERKKDLRSQIDQIQENLAGKRTREDEGRNGDEAHGSQFDRADAGVGERRTNYRFRDILSIYLCGLPPNVRSRDIVQFFAPLVCTEIRFIVDDVSCTSGIAIVVFGSTDDARQALTRTNQHLRSRKVRLIGCWSKWAKKHIYPLRNEKKREYGDSRSARAAFWNAARTPEIVRGAEGGEPREHQPISSNGYDRRDEGGYGRREEERNSGRERR